MVGYTRRDTANNIANGNVIDADDFDAEFNAIEDAFKGVEGHNHDGSPDGGSRISVTGPGGQYTHTSDAFQPSAGQSSLDIGTLGQPFDKGFFSGALRSGDLDVVGNAVITGNITVAGDGIINGNLTFGDADTDSVSFGADIDSDLLPEGVDKNIGSVGKQWNDLWVGGEAHLSAAYISFGDITNTPIDTPSLIATTADINGGTIDGVTIGGAAAGAITGTTITGTSFVGPLTGSVTGDVTGNASTATKLATTRNIALAGDVTGNANFDGSGNISITTTVAANSVALGTDTTGNYVQSLVAGTGVSLANNTGENATPTISIGQAVGTSSNVTFNDLVVSGNLTVSGTTTTVNTETINLADNIITLNSNETGTPTQNGGIEVERGTAANKSLLWDEATDKWTVGSDTFVAGSFEGNAATTTKWANSRTVSFSGGDVSGSFSIDGSANVSNVALTVADDSHNHIISNVDGLQTALNGKAALAGSSSQNFSAQTLNATTVDLGDWTITESGTTLLFKIGATTYMKLDSSGNLTVRGDITAKDTSI